MISTNREETSTIIDFVSSRIAEFVNNGTREKVMRGLLEDVRYMRDLRESMGKNPEPDVSHQTL